MGPSTCTFFRYWECHDRHLCRCTLHAIALIVEVKAGAFTYTSPATDLAAHISSLKGLLLAPASQGSRFFDYLESAPEVSIAETEHNEIGRLRRSVFRHVTVCAVTLDPLAGLAARVQHLRKTVES